MKKVAVIMGSDSDLPIAKKAADTLTSLGIPFEVHVYSAHRTPDEAKAFAASAAQNGFGAIIAIAGMAVRNVYTLTLRGADAEKVLGKDIAISAEFKK